MNNSLLVESEVVPSVEADGSRVLFALSERDEALFLGADSGIGLPEHAALEAVDKLDAAQWEWVLRDRKPAVLVTGWSTPPLPKDWLMEADCSLHYVCHLAGSVRRLVPRVFLERGGVVTNWGNLAGPAVAEHALLLALAALRNIKEWEPYLATPVKQRALATAHCRSKSLFHRRVGIHGFGSVARSLVKLLRPFQVKLAAYSEGVPASVLEAQGVESCSSLADLITTSEIFFECEALTEATTGSVTAALLRKLPADAVFVNVARGRLIEKSALMAEGVKGRIRVALDVSFEEPMTADLPVCQLPGVIISPHIAGPTLDVCSQVGELAMENVDRYLRGENLKAEVTLEIYDRST